MRDFWSGLFRVLTILLVIILIVGILGGGLWYLLRQNAPAQDDGVGVSLDTLRNIGVGLYLQLQQDKISQPISDDASTVSFRIEEGETPATIAQRLRNQGLIADERIFRLLVGYLGVDSSLEAGDYTLRRNMSMEEIVAELQHGLAYAIKITTPEGWRLEQIAQLSAREGLVDEGQFLALASGTLTSSGLDYDFLRDRPAGSPTSLEGFLFPDTYQVNPQTGTQAFIELMLRTFDQKVTPEMRQRAAERRMTLYEVVTLASIVEREAVVNEERPIIASVYLNRLARGMYLQADPTVMYAKGFSAETGRWWNPMLIEEAQTVNSPYNTYLYPGLTPGPICNPGLASIQAVLYPADTPYLFFLAKGDGSHVFAETYEEHLVNYDKYMR